VGDQCPIVCKHQVMDGCDNGNVQTSLEKSLQLISFMFLYRTFTVSVLRLWGVQKKTKDPTDFLFIQDRAAMLPGRSVRMFFVPGLQKQSQNQSGKHQHTLQQKQHTPTALTFTSRC